MLTVVLSLALLFVYTPVLCLQSPGPVQGHPRPEEEAGAGGSQERPPGDDRHWWRDPFQLHLPPAHRLPADALRAHHPGPEVERVSTPSIFPSIFVLVSVYPFLVRVGE